MIHYVKLIRPVNLVIIAVTMTLFRVCLVDASPYKLFYVEPVLSVSQFMLLVVMTLLIAAGGYIINDIYDVEIDAVNKPGKLIIGQHINETAAYNLYKLLSLFAVLIAIVLAVLTKNFKLSTFPIIIMVLLNFYAHTFKQQLIVGNVIIAFCTASTIWLIALFETTTKTDQIDLAVQVQSGIAIAAIIYGLFAFLTTFLREIIKDAEDSAGDEQFGCRTIPVVWKKKGVIISSLIITLLLLLILISFALFFPNINVKNISLFIAFGLILPLIVIVFFIFKANAKADYHFVSNLIKFFMCLGIASMLYFRTGIGPYIFVQYANFIKKLF